MQYRATLLNLLFFTAILLASCERPADQNKNLLEETFLKAASDPQYSEEFEDQFLDSDVYIRAQYIDAGRSLQFYKVTSSDRSYEMVPVYMDEASYNDVLSAEGEALAISGREFLRLTGGLAVSVNHGLKPQIIWDPEYADDLRRRCCNRDESGGVS